MSSTQILHSRFTPFACAVASSSRHRLALSRPLANLRQSPRFQATPASSLPFTHQRAFTTPSSASSSSSTPPQPSPSPPRRPSPYRIPHLSTFLSRFAPLHVVGWRLDDLPPAPTIEPTNEPNETLRETVASTTLSKPVEVNGADLQGRRMVRQWAFEPDKEGWTQLVALFDGISKIVHEEDHHPTILVAPSSDVPSTTSVLTQPGVTSDPTQPFSSSPGPSYILHLSTYTHTPLPPLAYTDTSGRRIELVGKPKGGVTGKDLKLAERIEELCRTL